jgi:hypothetical protein
MPNINGPTRETAQTSSCKLFGRNVDVADWNRGHTLIHLVEESGGLLQKNNWIPFNDLLAKIHVVNSDTVRVPITPDGYKIGLIMSGFRIKESNGVCEVCCSIPDGPIPTSVYDEFRKVYG